MEREEVKRKLSELYYLENENCRDCISEVALLVCNYKEDYGVDNWIGDFTSEYYDRRMEREKF